MNIIHGTYYCTIPLKGGEIIHFRHFIVKGLIAGTALLFPADAFAEKAELAQKPDSQNGKAVEEVKAMSNPELPKRYGQAEVNSQVRNENSAEQHPAPSDHSQQEKSQQPVQKTVQLSDRVSERVQKTVQLPDKASERAQKAVQGPTKARKQIQKTVQVPNQASKKAQKAVQFALKENERAVINTLPEKVEVKQGEKKGTVQKENPQSTNQGIPSKMSEAKTPSEKSIHAVDSGEQISHQYTKMAKKLEDDQNLDQTMLKKKDDCEKMSFTDKPKSKGKENTPSRQERYLRDIQVTNSSQNTKIPGGSSKDRTGHGQSTTNFIEKWLEPEKHWNLRLIQPYVSRAYVYRNQWVNAPPSPPPKAAPFFLTYTISKNHG